MNIPDHEFTPPIDLSQAEASRLRELALAFHARWVPVGHWAFTPARGHKFELLWRTGWHAVEGRFFHPSCVGLHTQARAVAMGRVMK